MMDIDNRTSLAVAGVGAENSGRKPLDPLPAAEPSAQATHGPWRAAVTVLAASILAVLLLFAQTACSMAETWWGDRTYGHGFLVAPVTLYLVWLRRHELAALTPRPRPLALLLLLGAVIAWLVATAADVRLIQQAALVAMIQCLVLALLGWQVTRRILFPVMFLFFAVPFGNFLIPYLQQVTAHLSVDLLRLSGIPVFLDGLFIHIPSGRFVVAEACAGIRFLISTIVLGALLANLLFTTWWRRLLIVILSVAIPIIANGIRAYGIVLLGHLSNFRVAVGADHIVYGWVFFSVVTLSLLAVAFALRERDRPSVHEKRRTVAGKAAGSETPVRLGLIGVAAIMITASGPAYAMVMDARAKPAVVASLEAWRVERPWQPVAVAASWHPEFRATDAELLQSYSNGDQVVDLYMAAYAYQRQGAEIVNELNRLADETIWRQIGAGGTTVAIDGNSLPIQSALLASGDRKRLVWYWYWVDGRFTADPLVAKVLQAKTMLLGGVPAAAVIAVATEYEERPNEAASALRSFLESVPSLQTSLNAFAGTGAAVTAAGRS